MKFFKGILVITLALSVTIGGAGLRQIICKCFDCEKVLSLSKQTSCCCEDVTSCNMDETNDHSKNCCDKPSKTPCTPEVKKISFDWESRHIDSQNFAQITCLPVTIQTDLFLSEPVVGKSLFFADYSGPPLFSPKEYLSFIQVLLI